MAKYTATYKCGHTEEIQLFGKHDERERKLSRMAENLCPHCKRMEYQERTGVVLDGSDKQANWAYDIIARVNKVFDDGKTKIKPEFIDLLESVRADYNAHTSAKWWIDNAQYVDNRTIATAMKDKMNNQ